MQRQIDTLAFVWNYTLYEFAKTKNSDTLIFYKKKMISKISALREQIDSCASFYSDSINIIKRHSFFETEGYQITDNKKIEIEKKAFVFSDFFVEQGKKVLSEFDSLIKVNSTYLH